MNSEENTPQRKRGPSKFLYLLAAGAGALGLIGLGAFALWTTQEQVQQQVTSGAAPQITLTTLSPSGTVSGNTVTFNALTDLGPSFVSEGESYKMTNSGTATATGVSLQVSAVPGSGSASAALEANLSACIYNYTSSSVIYDGLLSGAISASPMTWNTVLAPAASENDVLILFAGNQTTLCNGSDTGPQLPVAAGDGTLALSLTYTLGA